MMRCLAVLPNGTLATPLLFLSEMVGRGLIPHHEADKAMMELKVYTRPEKASGEDDTPTQYLERKTVPISISELMLHSGPNSLMDFVGARHDEDLALGNAITMVNRAGSPVMFIPQMDFDFPLPLEAHDGGAIFPASIYEEYRGGEEYPMYLFCSGRSLHGYGMTLMTAEEWTRYMGRMLLLNNVHTGQLYVDSRWIGKSLARNRSYLRITCNSPNYYQIPTFLRVLR